MTGETAIGGDNVRFQPTAWTVAREARDGSRDARNGLISVYGKPAYFFIRRRGHEVESAKDLTHWTPRQPSGQGRTPGSRRRRGTWGVYESGLVEEHPRGA